MMNDDEVNLYTVVGHVGDEHREPITLCELESKYVEIILRHESRRLEWIADQIQWQASLAVCRERGQRIVELEVQLAKAEAALEMADVMLTDYRWLCSDAGHPDPIIGEKYQKRREAMK